MGYQGWPGWAVRCIFGQNHATHDPVHMRLCADPDDSFGSVASAGWSVAPTERSVALIGPNPADRARLGTRIAVSTAADAEGVVTANPQETVSFRGRTLQVTGAVFAYREITDAPCRLWRIAS